MSNENDHFIETPNSGEDESDLGSLRRGDVAQVAVSGNDWTTETVLSQLKKGNIELNPRFQRRDAWELKRKSRFIESLILGLPVPPIVLAERPDARGKYIVLDGKQRLLCLRRFTAEPDDPDYKSFKLVDLEIRPDLNGRTYTALREDLQFRGDVTALENQPIRTVVLRNWTSEALLFHVFIRLNMGSKPLSPQELRQALHPGPFLDFADEAATESIAIRDIFQSYEPDFRMRDVELLIRYFSFRHLLRDYRGNMKEFLDKACATFNAEWNTRRGEFTRELVELDDAHKTIIAAFAPAGSTYNYGKWTGERFERRFNRAIFDVLIGTVVQPPVLAKVKADSEKLMVTLKDLCATDPKFLEAIERTTKSLDATRYRFQTWTTKLAAALEVEIVVPEIGS